MRCTSAKAELTHGPEFNLRQATDMLTEWMHHHNRAWNKDGVSAQASHESLEQQLCDGEIGNERAWMSEGIVNASVLLGPGETSG